MGYRSRVRKNSARFVICAGTAIVSAAAALPSKADPAAAIDIDQVRSTLADQKAKLDAQEKLLKAQMDQLEAQKKALNDQQQQIDTLRVQLEHTTPAGAAGLSKTAAQPLGTRVLGALRGTGTGGQIAQDQPVGQAPTRPERPPEINVLPDRGGVLTPRGALVYEPTFEFAHSTDSQAIVSGFTTQGAILVGAVNVTSVNHNTLQAVNTFRLGITNRAEAEVQVPYVYGNQETTTRPLTGSSTNTTTTTDGHGLGDIVVGGHYQFNAGEGGWPYFVGNVLFKTRTGSDPFNVPVDSNNLPTRVATGSGFYTLEPSVTAIYPSDPAVFFGSLGYLHSFSRSVNSPLVGGAATIEPGDAVHLSFGLGFGINEQSSFSLGYDYESFFKTVINNISQPGTDTQVGQVLIGYSYKFSDRVSATLTTSIGVTHDAPDTQVILRVPIKFQVFGDNK